MKINKDTFVYKSKTCSKSVETRYHCTVCDDFDLCVSCYQKDGHPHKMEELGFDLDEGGDESLTTSNPQEARALSIQRCIQSLEHACQCRDANCGLPSCHKMKRVLSHAKQCERKTNRGCPICKQLIALCQAHAKLCQDQEAKCPVPFCLNIKQKLRRQKLYQRPKEASLSQRSGHTAVTHGKTVLVWGGWGETVHPGEEIMIFNSLTQRWTTRKTTGDVTPGLVGAAAAVLDHFMYVVAVTVWTDSEFKEDIWALNLKTFVWSKLSPEGVSPLRCCATAAWSHDDKIWMFGGGGTPPSANQDIQLRLCGGEYVPLHGDKGISNQLVCYDPATNSWEWPASSGPAPSPRTGHSVAKVDDTVYVFGGIQVNGYVNDFYSLDLNTLRWKSLISENSPVGRTWASMTPIQTGKEEAGLLLYGGLGNNGIRLGDCWRIDLEQQPSSWVRCPHLELGPRDSHASVALGSQVMVTGGSTNIYNLAEHDLFLRVTPPSLKERCLEFIRGHKDGVKDEKVKELPETLQRLL